MTEISEGETPEGRITSNKYYQLIKDNTYHEIMREFEKRFEKDESGCWLWSGYTDKKGYGNFHFNYKSYRAHRVSYILHEPQRLKGELVLHKCDVRNCVNFDHLYLGDYQDNKNDQIKRGRIHRPIGEENPKSVLSGDDVKTIFKEAWGTNKSANKIANDYPISNATVLKIKNGERWAEITDELQVEKQERNDKYLNKGENHPGSKLTEKLVREIKRDYKLNGLSRSDINEKYDFPLSTLEDIIYEQGWKHVRIEG